MFKACLYLNDGEGIDINAGLTGNAGRWYSVKLEEGPSDGPVGAIFVSDSPNTFNPNLGLTGVAGGLGDFLSPDESC